MSADGVRRTLLREARAAYRSPEPVECVACGAETDTVDGYDVSDLVGREAWLCPDCNRDPLNWDGDDALAPALLRRIS